MTSMKYNLRYLPLFYEDLEEKIVYIAEKLHNEKAANDLLDEVERAILERQPVAESFEPYRSLRERHYPYYRIYVKNFVIYYVVIDDEGEDKIMEVRRFLYNKQYEKSLLQNTSEQRKIIYGIFVEGVIKKQKAFGFQKAF